MSFLYGSILWLLLPLGVYLYQRKIKQRFVQNLRWIVLVLLMVALARPVLFEGVTKEAINAHSLVVALDLSVSMNASDIKPTRAVASRESIKKFLELKRYEQVALIGFTTNPLLLSPPTTDHELLILALENMNSEYILTKGTNLKKLFEKIAQFKDKSKKVILFTDGGDEVFKTELITFVQNQNIKILAVAMATHQGASITQKDGKLLENREGSIVVSKLNRSLEVLVKESGGKLIDFKSVEDTVTKIEEWLENQKVEEKRLERESKQYFELGFVPLFLALILFLVSETRLSKRLLALLLFIGINVQAQSLEERRVKSTSWSFLDTYYLKRAYVNYETEAYEKSKQELYKIKNRGLEAQLLLAHVFYKQEKYIEAKSILKSIRSSDKRVKQQLYYELGNCEAKLLYLDKAKNYYVKALQLGKDADTLHNLEVVLFRVKSDNSKVGYTNPSLAEKSNAKSEDTQVEETKMGEKKDEAKKDESLGASGGSGNKKSKNSTVKVLELDKESRSKRVLSSKAYDLINEGYIEEEKPW